jgi:hypothetical protein
MGNEHPETAEHNYKAELEKLLVGDQEPGLVHALIFHDDWCDVYSGGFCNCKSEIVLVPDSDEVVD